MILTRLENASDTIPMAAVFVQRSDLGAHIGVLYPDDDGSGWTVHQGWNYFSQTEPLASVLDDDPVWLVPPALDRDEQLALRAMAVLAARKLEEGALPYAFGSARLDREQGFVLDGGCGLSCATFVNVLFEAAKIPLVDLTTWASQRSEERAKEDREAQEWVADRLAESRKAADREQAVRVRINSDRPRLRAEEVAAASGQQSRPLDLRTTEPLGRQLLDELSRAGE